jgi:hypothetical protein
MNDIDVAAARDEVGGRPNNRAENSRQQFRRRERVMRRFRSMKTLQKFSSVHAQVHNQFNQECHLVTRQVYKRRRSAAWAERRALAAKIAAREPMFRLMYESSIALTAVAAAWDQTTKAAPQTSRG